MLDVYSDPRVQASADGCGIDSYETTLPVGTTGKQLAGCCGKDLHTVANSYRCPSLSLGCSGHHRR